MKGTIPLTHKQIKKCLKYFDEKGGKYKLRNKALFRLGLSTGFRISELLSLKIEDVYNIERKKILPSVYLKKENSKKKIEGRTMKIRSNAKESLKEYIFQLEKEYELNNEDILFFSQKDKNKAILPCQAWRIYKKCFDYCGIEGKVGTHSTRKTVAKEVYEKTNHDIMSTQKALGHKNVSSTGSYLSFNMEEIDKALDGCDF